MKKFLAISFVLITIASFLVFFNPHQASAVPVSYNITSLSAPFTSYTKTDSGLTNFDLLIDAGYNGTVNSVYQGRASNNTINYEFGYHPTLTTTLDTFNNITASASVAATQSLPITIASGHNNVALVVGVVFEHTTNTDHNKARMASVAIGANSFSLIINKTVTCGAAACDSEIWALGNNTALTGAQTITITPSDVTNYHMVAGVYSLYNTRSIRPIDSPASATGTSVTPSVTITRLYQSSMVIDNMLTLQTGAPSANNLAKRWVGHTTILTGGSQSSLSAISGASAAQWTTTNVQWISTGVEIVPIQNSLKNFGFNTAWDTQYVAGATNKGYMTSNGSKIYYVGNNATAAGKLLLQSIDTITGVETHVGTQANAANCQNANGAIGPIFFAQKSYYWFCSGGTANYIWNNLGGNFTSGVATFTNNDEMVMTSTGPAGLWFNSNNTGALDARTVGTAPHCYLTYNPSNTTTPIDDIGCDRTIPNHVARFWNGMYIYKIGNYYSNSTLNFLTTIDAHTYKKQLTIPASVYGIPDPDVKIIGHWGSPGADYLLSVSSTQINYAPMAYLTTLLNQNRAFQSYDLTLTLTDNHFFLSPSGVNPSQNIKLYGQNGLFLNTTVAKYGMIGLPSGYSMRTTASSESVIRTIDPRWTNTPSQDYPAITTTTSLFPIVLTVSNAPTDAALWLSNGAQVINNVNSAWCITQLDTTHTAECDIPPNQCANVYVADTSVAPTIFNYEGNVCATGTNVKTIAYTNTLPLSFYTMNYAATSTFTPSTNGLQTTVRATISPFTYNVLIKNSTGAITQNYTTTIAGTIDTHTFNVTNATKPASLYVSVSGVGQIYSAYLGSSLTLASVSSFFHQYFSYQGFDLLSFIPIIFASMFTRNTVGIGTALTVVCIASLSWLSIVVIPDNYIIIMVVVAIMAMVGYRGIYG